MFMKTIVPSFVESGKEVVGDGGFDESEWLEMEFASGDIIEAPGTPVAASIVIFKSISMHKSMKVRNRMRKLYLNDYTHVPSY